MEISRDAIVRMIRAARNAAKLANDIRRIANVSDRNNAADEIAGDLADVLNKINGEQIGISDQFCDSRTYTWLFRSAMSDNEVADEFIRMAEENKPEMPRPNTMSRVGFEELLEKFGGYKPTAEGEWSK